MRRRSMTLILLKTLLLLFLTAIMGLAACNSRRLAMADEPDMIRVPQICLLSEQVRYARVIFKEDDGVVRMLSGLDRQRIAGWLRECAEYDTEWNESGIMVKMVDPDYLMIVRCENKSADEFVMIWRGQGKVKYNGKWYLINSCADARKIYELLESYRTVE